MYKKISLKEKWPPVGIWILFINETTHESDFLILWPETNVSGLSSKYTHWLQETIFF